MVICKRITQHFSKCWNTHVTVWSLLSIDIIKCNFYINYIFIPLVECYTVRFSCFYKFIEHALVCKKMFVHFFRWLSKVFVLAVRDCSLFIGSTGPVFGVRDKDFFQCFRVRDTKIFCVFMVRDMNFFSGKKSLKLYFIDILNCRVCWMKMTF